MYRLVLYALIILVILASIFSAFSHVSYSPKMILFSAVFFVGVCWIANIFFSWVFKAPTNVESAWITGLILALIVSPPHAPSALPLLIWIAIIAMFSKYVLAIRKKHIFNPVAIALVIISLTLGESSHWWVGTAWMAPFVALTGFLIFRKLRLGDLGWSFFVTSLVVSGIIAISRGFDPLVTMSRITLDSSMLFLGAIMLTEPLTMPPTKKLQMVYGSLVGFLALPQVSLMGLSFTPEMALCIGNIFAYVVSPKEKFLLLVSKKVTIAKDAMEFVFTPPHAFSYKPGQYMEWTLPHHRIDSRGNRRYFTLASSPTEDVIRLGVKFSSKGSSYKKAMVTLDKKTTVVAAQIAGEFTLPKNKKQKLAFIAGGIGITPFRSMVKYVLDTGERRDIVLCYSNKIAEEIAYKDIFEKAHKSFGMKTIYTLTNTSTIPSGWKGGRGRIDAALIEKEIPDFKERFFYLSGPQSMVNAYEEVLQKVGVPTRQIKKDFFPGLV